MLNRKFINQLSATDTLSLINTISKVYNCIKLSGSNRTYYKLMMVLSDSVNNPDIDVKRYDSPLSRVLYNIGTSIYESMEPNYKLTTQEHYLITQLIKL